MRHTRQGISAWILLVAIAGCTTPPPPLSLPVQTFSPAIRHVIADLEQGQLSLQDRQALSDNRVRVVNRIGAGPRYVVAAPTSMLMNGAMTVGTSTYSYEEISPRSKISIRIRSRDFPDWAKVGAWVSASECRTNQAKIVVEFFEGTPLVQARNLFRTQNLQARKLGIYSWRVIAQCNQIDRLAREDIIRHIELGPEPLVPASATILPVVGTDDVQCPIGTCLGTDTTDYALSGRSIKVGVADWGILTCHDDFKVVAEVGLTDIERAKDSSLVWSNTGTVHGTIVAGIIGGNGWHSTPRFCRRGQAPEATLIDYWKLNYDAEKYHFALETDKVLTINHSYTYSELGNYNIAAREIDRISKGVKADPLIGAPAIPARPHVWGAGNTPATIKAPAKNPITVGSTDSLVSDPGASPIGSNCTTATPCTPLNCNVSSFSSTGPTNDKRVKPDLVAPGCRYSLNGRQLVGPSLGNPVEGSCNGDGKTYGVDICGTSYSTPVVTGALALLLQEQTVETLGSMYVYPSTYKAVLVQSAVDMPPAGPDFQSGYGMLNAPAALDVVRSEFVKEASVVATGDVQEYCMIVNAGDTDVRVTLAWDDEPAASCVDTAANAQVALSQGLEPCWETDTSAKALRNDLDLKLQRPDKTELLPWTIIPPETTARQNRADHLNNVEVAEEANPLAGTWRVMVSGFDIEAGTATQPFSLAASHQLLEPCPQAFEFRKPMLRTDPPELLRYFAPRRLDDICPLVIECPICSGGPPWTICQPWSLEVTGLEESANVLVLDQHGRELSRGRKRGASTLVTVPERRQSDRLFLMTTPDGSLMPPKGLELGDEVLREETPSAAVVTDDATRHSGGP